MKTHCHISLQTMTGLIQQRGTQTKSPFRVARMSKDLCTILVHIMPRLNTPRFRAIRMDKDSITHHHILQDHTLPCHLIMPPPMTIPLNMWPAHTSTVLNMSQTRLTPSHRSMPFSHIKHPTILARSLLARPTRSHIQLHRIQYHTLQIHQVPIHRVKISSKSPGQAMMMMIYERVNES